MTIDAVLFDLDGTLVDHRGAVVHAVRVWFPELGRPADDGLVAAWFEAEERHFPDWEAGRIGFAEQRRRRLRDVLPLLGLEVPADDAELDALFARFLEHYRDGWRRFPDVDGALEAVAGAGLATGVLTNGMPGQQLDKLDRTGLRDRVGPVVTAGEIGVAKPHREAYLAACRRLGAAPERVLHVGDRHVLDVLAARAAGLRAVHLDRTGDGPGVEPCRIGGLAGLAAVLVSLGVAGAGLPCGGDR